MHVDGSQTILVWHALASRRRHIRNMGPELEALVTIAAPHKSAMNQKKRRRAERARREGCRPPRLERLARLLSQAHRDTSPTCIPGCRWSYFSPRRQPDAVGLQLGLHRKQDPFTTLRSGYGFLSHSDKYDGLSGERNLRTSPNEKKIENSFPRLWTNSKHSLKIESDRRLPGLSPAWQT